MEERFNKRKGDYEGFHDSYNYGGYNYKRSSQTLGTTSRPLSYNNLRLPILWGTFGPYDNEVWEQKVESLFHSYVMSMRAQPIKTWSLMKKSLRNRFGVRNHKGQTQGQQRLNSWNHQLLKKFQRILKIQAMIKVESLPTRVEDKGRSMKKELGTILEELPITLSLNPSFMCSEVSFVRLKLFLESYLSPVSIIGDLCAISFGDGLFLVMCYVSKCLSSHTSLDDPLMSSSVKFYPFCYGSGMLDNTSLVGPKIIGFEIDCAIFYILHDECLGKFIENVDHAFPFLDAFMKNLDEVIPLNQHLHFLNDQFEFSYSMHKLSSVVNSLNLLFENTFGFKFYHFHFKQFLLKHFGIMIEVGFEQVFKDFFVRHLYYHKPFKEWFLKNNISLILFWKNYCALILKHEFEATLFNHLLFKEFFDKMVFKEESR
ncbi:hypothetical protein M9H77_18126 [Catharanthus roseus]|uniref:Uncharacterized protein n=1 Tax=Catharanthus roseus TaxID=4058 RepID=A0ACC0B6W2_CATRO|nr:hypothetical protein M9H77_18126 [Catharanthus roseus]